MYVQVDRLMTLLNYLDEALQATKEQRNVTVEQVLKAEDINLAENAQLNIQQNQYVVIHQADKWIGEAKQITEELLRLVPSEILPLPESVKMFKQKLIKKALELENGNQSKAAKRIGMKRTNLRYFMQ